MSPSNSGKSISTAKSNKSHSSRPTMPESGRLDSAAMDSCYRLAVTTNLSKFGQLLTEDFNTHWKNTKIGSDTASFLPLLQTLCHVMTKRLSFGTWQLKNQSKLIKSITVSFIKPNFIHWVIVWLHAHMTKRSRFTTWDPNTSFKSTKAMKDQSNQLISILIVHIWSHLRTMEPPKYGTPKKENCSTPLKPIPTTLSSVAKVTTSSVVALKRQSTSGSADFMTQWRKRSSQASLLSVTWTTKRKSSRIQNPQAEKLMKDPNLKESSQDQNCA